MPVSIDHIVIGNPTADGNKYITSFIDNFTGLVYSYLAPDISAQRTARMFRDIGYQQRYTKSHFIRSRCDLIGDVMTHLAIITLKN